MDTLRWSMMDGMERGNALLRDTALGVTSRPSCHCDLEMIPGEQQSRSCGSVQQGEKMLSVDSDLYRNVGREQQLVAPIGLI